MRNSTIEHRAQTAKCTDDDVRFSQRRRRHWFMLWLSIAVVVCALSMQIGGTGRVHSKVLPDIPLPVLCGSRAIFGFECPGCGLTRSFVALAGGDVAESVRFHRVGWVLAIAVVLQIPYRTLALMNMKRPVAEPTWQPWFGWTLIVLLVGNWIGNVTHLF